ncbi:hypothetical protein Aph02nite_43400 [Actinoplanes philippinensis]|nr:hypothetical protein Aph02nite_43400 [Actinoplanes philippinensis]
MNPTDAPKRRMNPTEVCRQQSTATAFREMRDWNGQPGFAPQTRPAWRSNRASREGASSERQGTRFSAALRSRSWETHDDAIAVWRRKDKV